MRKIFLLIFFMFVSSHYSYAVNGAALQDQYGNAINSSNPLQVHCVSGCSGSGGPGLWEVNNVGIDTFNAVGIGSTNPGQALDVNGTVRATAFQAGTGSAFISGSGGNVGISNASGYTPAQQLDVNGTAKMTGFQLGTSTTSGWVLTASSSGVGTWQAATGGSGLWTTTNTNDVYEVNSGTYGNVGIGTLSTGTNRLAVTGGNVSIGTVAAASSTLVVGGLAGGNVSIGTSTAAPTNGLLVLGNVGIGSAAPGQALDVNGTLRGTALIATGTGFSQFMGGNVGIGTTVDNTGALQINKATNASGVGDAVGLCASGSGYCIGYCTTGTYPTCGTCTCLAK